MGKFRRFRADVLYHAEDAVEALRERVRPSGVSMDDPRAPEMARRYGEARAKARSWKYASTDDQTPDEPS